MSEIPQVHSVMTPLPHSIDADANLLEAQSMMERHGIRHLPVTQEGRLVGIISDRDIRHFVDPIVNSPPLCKVRKAMIAEPYVVAPTEPLDTVLLTLAARRIGCVVVADDGRPAGIFTTTDASRMLGEHLRASRPTRPDGTT